MSNKQQRRICQYCGSKRNISQLQEVYTRHGKRFQAGKEVTLYVCKKQRSKKTAFLFCYCNGEQEPPDITWRTFKRG